MKKTTLVLMLALTPYAHAAYESDIFDVAEVVSVSPNFSQVYGSPQQCYTTQVLVPGQRSGERSNAGPILGGIAGAILGNQVGRGNGRTAAVAAGAIAGTIVGENLSDRRQSYSTYETVVKCSPGAPPREVITGYTVMYRYNGQLGRTIMRSEPGNFINVTISPR